MANRASLSAAMMPIVAAVLLCSLQVAVASRELLQYAGTANTPAPNSSTIWAKGMLNDLRLDFDDVPLRELKGVYETVGDWYPQSVYTAITDNKMPQCNADVGTFNYNRLDATATQYYILAGSGSTVYRVAANLQRSTFANTTGYNDSKILTTSNAGVVSCAHFSPYVDLQTGELMAESITMTLWTLNPMTGSPTRTSLACEVVGDEKPGCYSNGMVARMAGPAAPVQTLSISTPIARPVGSIVTVTKTSYICRNGECLKLSPKWATESPAYGG